jgi:hypothetical protein
MILDAQARFEWQNAIANTRVSTNTYDLGVANCDIGRIVGDNLWLVGIVTTAFTRAAGAFTLTADFVDDDNAALSSPATLFNLCTAVPKATLLAGYRLFEVKMPINKITQRYVGINWTCSAAPDAGAVSAFWTPNIDGQFAFPRGYVNY